MTDQPLERLNATTVKDAPDWWLAEPLPKPADNYDPEMGELAYSVLTDNLDALNANLGEADTLLADACRYLAETDTHGLTGLAILAEQVANLKRGLAIAEAFVSREAGHLAADSDVRDGFMPDGRPFSVKRGANRKGWDHVGWKRDVVNAITVQVPESQMVVDTETGEELDARKTIGGYIAQAQAVHGAGAPKVTVLKALGLRADDYAEVHAGPYTVIITPTTEN